MQLINLLDSPCASQVAQNSSLQNLDLIIHETLKNCSLMTIQSIDATQNLQNLQAYQQGQMGPANLVNLATNVDSQGNIVIDMMSGTNTNQSVTDFKTGCLNLLMNLEKKTLFDSGSGSTLTKDTTTNNYALKSVNDNLNISHVHTCMQMLM